MSMWLAARSAVSTLMACRRLLVGADATGRPLGLAAAVCALRIALDVALPLAGHAESARRHVVGDHRAGGGVGVVAHADRCDEGRVDRDADVAPDRRAVLRPPVVVGGDRAGADVGALP